VSYRLVDELQTNAVPVAQTCCFLGVSRAGFYEAKRRAVAPTCCKASVHLRAAFMSSGQSYGSRRLFTAIANSGLKVGRYKVCQLMQQASLAPVWRCKFVHTTDSKHGLPIAQNVFARRFDPATPNLAYESDITYIRTGAGWLYLAVMLDLFSRRVVGWAMAPSMPAALACDALRMAIKAHRPPAGLVVHSDRGSQYASNQYQALLAEHGFVCIISRKGNCWDSAVAERFFLSLKMERVWQRNYANHAEAKFDMANYIAGFYNCERHSVLGNLLPSVYERKMAEKELIVVSEIT
jgi:putative transposase